MGKKKKKWNIPFSKWTPIVQGLSSDASEICSEASDLDSPNPLEPLEEQNERHSEEESGHSLSNDSETSETSFVDEIHEIEDTIADLETGQGNFHQPENLGLRSSRSLSDPVLQNVQLNPSSSIQPEVEDPSILLNSEHLIPPVDLIPCSSKVNGAVQLSDAHCSTSLPHDLGKTIDFEIPKIPEPSQPGNGFKGQWNNLFADNRRPIDEFMLQKVHFPASDGFLDFSDEKLVDDFMFEMPFCLIGYFFGKFPGVLALRRLCDSWSPGISFNLHNSGWIVFRFPQESTLLQVMQQGTYVLSGQILIIRRMPPFFDFAKEGRSLMPLWVILPNIPLKMMRREFLQVLGSQIGTPIMTDKLTHTMERVSFAGMLIE
ncbi:hypothetical protein Dimus_006199, partial [Dionaea muscipula]